MESPTSTCVLSLSNVSTSDLGNDMTSPAVVATITEYRTSNPPRCKGVPLFEPGDGDMHVSVNGIRFETHKYLIKRFRGLRLLLENNPLEINILRNDISAGDFCETFKVLYTSVIAAPFVFSSRTLVSALRVATAYEYYALREYCIQYLETLELGAVKRIEIAREFQLPTWEELAYHELEMRDEPITIGEAKMIGLDAFVSIAETREKEQRRRGREIGAVCGRQDARNNGPGDNSGESAPHAPLVCTHLAPHDNKPETNDTTTCVDNSGTEMGLSLADIERSSAGDFWPERDHHAEITDCKPYLINGGKIKDRECATFPCTISAFKGIQVQQLAHANRISRLESSVKDLSASITAKHTPTIPKAQLTCLKLVPELSSVVGPGPMIRPAGLLMPAFPKLRGWGQ
ncbi:unnamed protein product [Rhizoctonia solani]|uniref:BTB domain-containing protein n=1 Tax=Rhizoctonia solani TaxID=456999 RepID=A0A8H3CXC2_9AGAM|nr:unnamed protein product [Rhizoctonia solani]